MSWRWGGDILHGVGGLLSELITLKAKGSTLWKVLLTSTLIAWTESSDLLAERMISDDDGSLPDTAITLDVRAEDAGELH